jgi:hypothetical protein
MKNVLITGTTSGIGKALAEKFASEKKSSGESKFIFLLIMLVLMNVDILGTQI